MAVILGGRARDYGGRAAALTGRLDPTPDVAAAGAWKEALGWGTKIQEARSDRRRACRSNVVRCGGLGRANKASHGDPDVWSGGGVADPEVRTGNRNRRARVPEGNPRTVRS
jgi:hypothetical protein